MKHTPVILRKLLLACTIVVTASCNNNETKSKPDGTDTAKTTKKETVAEKPAAPAEKPAIINILDTISPKAIVVFMKDSVASYERIGEKLGKIYGVKLADVLKKNGCKMAGPPMAWYKTVKAPFFFEAGVAVNKKPAKLPAGVYIRELAADSAMVAHFYGPYNLLSQGYEALKERMKEGKRKSSAPPYEIYVGDPVDAAGKPVDPYKVRTDIVFPYK